MNPTEFFPPDFNHTYRGRQMFKLDANPSLAGFFGWDDLNDILDLSLQHPASLSLVKGGKSLEPAKYLRPSQRGPSGGTQEVVPAAVSGALDDGYSLVLNNLPAYSPRVQRLADELTKLLEEAVNINAYCSWSQDRCFPTHWDSHDVFIVQVEGSKDWRVFAPTRLHPMDKDAAYDDVKPDEEPNWSGTLSAGEVLYIPRGWWHDASSLPGGSIHLTCGFTNRTGISLIQYLADLASRNVEMRRDLPRPTSKEQHAETLQSLRAVLHDLVDDDLLEKFWFAHRAELPPRRKNSLPHSISRQYFDIAERPLIGSALVAQIKQSSDHQETSISLGGKTWVFRSECGPLLQRISQGQVVTRKLVTEMLGISTADADDLLFELLNEGVLCFAEPEALGEISAEAAE